MSCIVTKLHSVVKDFSPRGGSSIVEVEGKIIVFGGADREQTHFQDIMAYGGNSGSNFCVVKASGDVPMPRSGHAVAAYGKYMFLFGGIDFAEEAVFNDLYILDTDTFEWGYVGESGVEVKARNSHSLSIIQAGTSSYLVLYGGASPEHGPLSDTLYALLPDPSSIDMKSIYVKWEELDPTAPTGTAQPDSSQPDATVFTKSTETATAAAEGNPTTARTHPGCREMHGTCSYNGRMYISGGRNGDGAILSDVWELSASTMPSTVDIAHKEETPENIMSTVPVVLQWKRCKELELTSPRCAHGAAIVSTLSSITVPVVQQSAGISKSSPSDINNISSSMNQTDAMSVKMVLIGGFTPAGVSGDVICASIPSQVDSTSINTTGTQLAEVNTKNTTTSTSWISLALTTSITGRFGVAATAVSQRFITHLGGNKKYSPVFSVKAKEAITNLPVISSTHIPTVVGVGVLLFGGVCIEQDFADLHLLLL